jgi:Jacalin-like lectin domain
MNLKKRLFIAGLILIVAAIFGSGRASTQQASATEIAGGPGGNAFSDPVPEQGARVVEVQVHSGDYVDSVQLVYMLRDGSRVAGPQHGGTGGRLGVFQLDADEYLTGISGRTGSYIDSIQFQTNKRSSPTFGGRGGDREFRIDAPSNAQVTGFVGRAGQYVDALGLAFMPIRRRLFSGFGGAPQPGQTDLAGGSGGAEFIDADMPKGARIVEVRVHAGDYVDSVQMIYSLPNGRPVEAERHGGNGGRAASFRLDPGEYITGLSGRCGQYVDSLRIHTNRRTSELFGGRGGDKDYRIDVPADSQATGFMGRSGEYLDAIGLTYSGISAMPGRYRGRRRDR